MHEEAAALLISEHELEMQEVQEEADEWAATRVKQAEEQADERAAKRVRQAEEMVKVAKGEVEFAQEAISRERTETWLR